MHNLKRLTLLLTIFVCLFSVNTLSAETEAYLIGRDDLLEITVWQTPDLSKTLAVNSKGTIDYPILGAIHAAGMTPKTLADLLQKKLKQGYVKNPKVSVSVKEYNSKKILVFGAVEKPGLYKLKGPVSLLELLFMVGGVTADGKRMTVIRPEKVSEDAMPMALLLSGEEELSDSADAISVDLLALLSKGDLSQNIMIRPGDTIYVSSGTGKRFYVLGQVTNPGPYEWTQEITVLEAIKLAEGPTEYAAVNRILVRKKEGGNETKIKVNMIDIMKGKSKDDVLIQDGDIVVVPKSWI